MNLEPIKARREALTALNIKDFYAHAPTDIAELVAEVERLQAVVLSQDDMDLPGMWSYSDFTGGDPDDRSYSQREKDAARIKELGAMVDAARRLGEEWISLGIVSVHESSLELGESVLAALEMKEGE